MEQSAGPGILILTEDVQIYTATPLGHLRGFLFATDLSAAASWPKDPFFWVFLSFPYPSGSAAHSAWLGVHGSAFHGFFANCRPEV